MSATRTRAFALWLKSNLTGVEVFSDFIDNVNEKYPAIELRLLTFSSEQMGCGRTSFTDYDSNDAAEAESKLDVSDSNFRITIRCPNIASTSIAGQNKVDNIVEQIKSLVKMSKIIGYPFVITDTSTSPTVDYSVEMLGITSIANIAPLTESKPFVYQSAVSVVVRSSEIESASIPAIESIDLEYEIA